MEIRVLPGGLFKKQNSLPTTWGHLGTVLPTLLALIWELRQPLAQSRDSYCHFLCNELSEGEQALRKW